MNEKNKNADAIHVVFRRLLGYFGRDERKSRGPTLLGMETDFHKFVPGAREIEAAIRDAKCEYKKGLISLR